MEASRHVELAVTIVSSQARMGSLRPAEIPELLRTVHSTLVDLDGGERDGEAASPPVAAAASPAHGSGRDRTRAEATHGRGGAGASRPEGEGRREGDGRREDGDRPERGVPRRDDVRAAPAQEPRREPVRSAPPTPPPPPPPAPVDPIPPEMRFERNGHRTVFEDHLHCLEDDKDVVLLSRHLGRLGMTPEQYRAKWNLPSDYPMVSPSYAATRREVAARTRFGRPAPAPRRREGRLSLFGGGDKAA